MHPSSVLPLLAILPTAYTISDPLQQILSSAPEDPLYTYPTAFTQDILPKNLHSHNDYWRPVPFYSALSFGAISVEADVWLYNGTLHVGHEESALTAERTFDALYVQPIVGVLKRQNPESEFVEDGAEKNGVFDAAAGQTMYLYVDVKTDGEETFPYVVRALEPLREGGFLTTFNGTGVTEGPITVIGTGNTPLNQIQGVETRDYFYDAPLPELEPSAANLASDVSLTANAAFSDIFGEVRNTTFNATQLAMLEEQVTVAHEKGMLVRYWDTPGWPMGTRNAVWRVLWDAGADLINVDDLAAASEFWEGSG